MNVFISWSGERSRGAAEALRYWLPKVIQHLKPWLSAADIPKGQQWAREISGKLKDCNAGIICLTPSNLHSDWILFEAGALSKAVEEVRVCTFLIGLEETDVEDPLAQFQATRATKDDVSKLMKTLNKALADRALPNEDLDEAFDVWWPKLEEKLKTLPPDGVLTQTIRSERDLLEELLALARSLARDQAALLDEMIEKTSAEQAERIFREISRMKLSAQ